MDRARGEEHVEAMFLRILQRLRRERDVVARAAGEPQITRPFDLARDRVDGLPVAARGGRESGFDHVDPEFCESARDTQLLGPRHAAAGRLLAVAQRGVENQDSVGTRGS
jgi:hypothetical protein